MTPDPTAADTRVPARATAAALRREVVCVPGVFFDVNPGGRSARRLSRFHQYVRLSFGSPEETLCQRLDGLEDMIQEARS